ncbi:hypothetical protein OC835_002474 [Tilletia horrida]|nr:hypothetical protein OC835_002474 [Tilletia horrida]
MSTLAGVSLKDFLAQQHDFVIVGGGTAGLALAARLSENREVTVAVLEAGEWKDGDLKVDAPACCGTTPMNPDYDWMMSSVPQQNAKGRTFAMPRGKALGGCSAINYMAMQVAHKKEYDTFGELAGDTQIWNWKEFQRCLYKCSTLHQPALPIQAAHGILPVTRAGNEQGTGPLQISSSSWFGSLQKDLIKAFSDKGLPFELDGFRGDPVGTWSCPLAIDPLNGKRSYSAAAYFAPNKDRPNLRVLTGAQAVKVELEQADDGLQRATGVTFLFEGKREFVGARREVISSAGTFLSPKLLELSGIGDRSVLEPLGIPVKVDLPGVGSNLQDHVFVVIANQLTDKHEQSFERLRDPTVFAAALEKYHSVPEGQIGDRGFLATSFSSLTYIPGKHFLSAEQRTELRQRATSVDWSNLSAGAIDGLKKTLEWLEDDDLPQMEFIYVPFFYPIGAAPEEGKTYQCIGSALQHPFYFSNPADLFCLSNGLQYSEKLLESEHIKSSIVKLHDAYGRGDAAIKDHDEYVKDFAETVHHSMGSCGAFPREKGGVVDSRLLVHGTKNLRVVDASVIPLMISTHPMATVYAIAERAAELIAEDNNVIVGGGTAGLVLAARLSEDPAVTVAVLEAGDWKAGDLKVEAPVLRGQTMMDPNYDWTIESVAQQNTKDRAWPLPRGRMLGGSSAQNFMVWNVGAAKEYDHLGECIGDPSLWNWKEISRCLRKATRLRPATLPLQLEHGAPSSADDAIHGSSGPIQLSYSHWFGPLHKQFNRAFDDLGLPMNPDGVSGNPIGYWCSPATVDPATGRRSDAASAYFAPNSTRPNLKVLTGALATRIELIVDPDGLQRASGVHFVYDGQDAFVRSKGEIISCAGALLSPKLLELSGIGSPSVLSPLDIDVKVNLPDVGEQLQDHIILYILAQLKDDYIGKTWDVLRDEVLLDAAMKQYLSVSGGKDPQDGEIDRGVIASTVCGLAYVPGSNFLNKEEREELRRLAMSADWSNLAPGTVEGLQKQLEWLDDDEIPLMEYLCSPGYLPSGVGPEAGKAYQAVPFCLQHPFSRGSVHIKSADPTVKPAVDPKYLSNPADLYLMTHAAKRAERILSSPHLKDAIAKHHDAYGRGDERIRDHEEVRIGPIETCFPLMLSTHIVASVYALAERAAELTREDFLQARQAKR